MREIGSILEGLSDKSCILEGNHKELSEFTGDAIGEIKKVDLSKFKHGDSLSVGKHQIFFYDSGVRVVKRGTVEVVKEKEIPKYIMDKLRESRLEIRK